MKPTPMHIAAAIAITLFATNFSNLFTDTDQREAIDYQSVLLFDEAIPAGEEGLQVLDLRGTACYPQLDELVACGTPDTLSILLFTKSETPLGPIDICLDMDEGLQYGGFAMLGTPDGMMMSILDVISTVNPESPCFRISEVSQASGGVVLQIAVQAGCGVDFAANPPGFTLNLDYNGCSESVPLDPIDIEPLQSEVVFTGAPPAVVIRDVMNNFCLSQNITQTVEGAAAGEVSFTLDNYGFPEIMFDSAALNNVGIDPAFIDVDPGTGAITIVFDGNSIPQYFGDGLLEENEVRRIDICFQIAECPSAELASMLPINPTLGVFTTCGGDVCAGGSGGGVDFEELGSISISPNFGATPVVTFETVQQPVVCGADGSPEPFIFELEMTSSLTDPLRGRFDNLLFLIDECPGGLLAIDSIEIYEGGTAAGALVPLPISGPSFAINGNGRLTINLRAVGMDPDAAGGLDDLDGDGAFDDLPGGASLRLRVYMVPPSCSSASVCSQDSSSEETVCQFTRIFTQGIRNCSAAFSIASTIDPPAPDPAVTAASSGFFENTVEFNPTSSNPTVGYNFGVFGTSAGGVDLPPASIDGRFGVTLGDDFNSCPSPGGDIKYQIIYTGDSATAADMIISNVLYDGNPVPAMDVTTTYLGTSVVFEINAGDPTGTHAWDFTLTLDTSACAPASNFLLTGQVVEECPDCECSSFFRACQTTFVRVDPSDVDCEPCNYASIVQAERIDYGFTDRTRTTPLTRADFPGDDNLELDRWLPGDTVAVEAKFAIKDADAFNDRTERISLVVTLLQDGVATTQNLLGRLDLNAARVQELTINRGATVFDFATVTPFGGLNNTFDGVSLIGSGTVAATWANQVHPGLPPASFLNGTGNTTNDFRDGSAMSATFWGEDRVAPGGFNSLDALYDLIGGEFSDEDTICLIWNVPVILTPDVVRNGNPTVGPLNNERLNLRGTMTAFDFIPGTTTLTANFALASGIFNGTNGATACIFQDTGFIQNPGIELASVIEYDPSGCSAEITHDFTITNPLPADWYQSPAEYRPIIGLERLFSEWPSPYIYSGGSTYEILDDGMGPIGAEPDSIAGSDLVGDAHCVADRYGELFWIDSEQADGLRPAGYDDYDTQTDISLVEGTYPLIAVGGETTLDPDTLQFVIPLTRLCSEIAPETPVDASHMSSYEYLSDYDVSTYTCNNASWYDGTGAGGTRDCGGGVGPTGRYWPWTRDSIQNPHRFQQTIFGIGEIGTPVPGVSVNLSVAMDPLADAGGGEMNTVTVCPDPGESLAGGVMIIEVPSNISLDASAPVVTEEMSTDSSTVYSIEIPMGLTPDVCFDLELTTTLLFCGPEPICISAVPCPSDAALVLAKMLDCVEEICYNYRAGLPELQAGFDYPGQPAPCVAQAYRLNLNNTGTSFLSDMCVVAFVPEGLLLMPPNSMDVTVTEGGVPMTITVPIAEETALTGVSGVAYKLDVTAFNGALGADGLEPGGTIEIDFMGETTCDYTSGSQLALMVEAEADCEPFEFFDRGQPFDVVDPAGSAAFTVNVEPLEISCEDGGADIRITAINTGKAVATDATVCLVLPPELSLSGGMAGISVVGPSGFVIENYTEVPSGTGGAMAISFDAPDQDVGDFLCLDLELALSGDAECGPLEFSFDIKTTQSIICPTLPGECDIQVSGNPSIFTLEVVPDAKVVDALLIATDCGTAGMIDLLWELELMSLTSDMITVDIEFFQDLDGDGMVDGFEPSVATAAGVAFSFGTAGGMDRQTGTITVAAEMACPLVARVNFPTECACSMLEVAFPEVIPAAIAELGDAVALCPGEPLELEACDGLELALMPASAGTITSDGTIVTLNPGFGVIAPVQLVGTYDLGECTQEFMVSLTQLEEFTFPDQMISACEGLGNQPLDLGIPNSLEEDIVVSIMPATFLDDATSQEPTLIAPTTDITYTVTYILNPGPDQCETTAEIVVTVFEPPSIVDLEYVLECLPEATIPLMEVAEIGPAGLDGTWGTLGGGTFDDTQFSAGMAYTPTMAEFDAGEVQLLLATDPIRDTVGGVPVIVCGPLRDTITVRYNCIEVAITKEVDTIYASAVEGEYVVKYITRITNLAGDLDSVMVEDALDAQLGAAYVRLCDMALDGMAPLVLSEPATIPGNISANPNWGTGGDWELTEFDQDTLFETDSFAFCMCIVVDPDAPEGSDSNTVTVNGMSPTVTGTETADTAGARFEIPAIGLAKFVDPAMPPTENPDDPNNFDVSYCWVVTNIGNVPLDSITLTDDFGFYGPAFTGTILSPPMVTMSDNPAITANMAWNPTTPDIDLITPIPPGDVLLPSETFTVCTRVVIDPSQSPLGDTLLNIAATTGMDENGTEVQDSSDSGMEPEGPGYEDPTPLLLPQIALAKFIDPATPPVYPAASGIQGNVDVTFCFTVENTGNVPLDSIVLFEDFGMYGAAVVGVTTPPSISMNNSDLVNLAPNLSWDPLASMFDLIEPTTMFASGDTLQPNDNFTICATIEINLNANLPDFDSLLNQAVTMGSDPNGNDVEDLSDNGMDPDSTNMMGGFDDPTPFAFPAIGLAKDITNTELLGPPDFPVANFAVTYEFVIENIGNVPLDSLQLCDDINAQYGLPGAPVGPFVSVLSQPMITASDADIDPIPSGTYDGGVTAAGACMFDGMSGSILPGQTITLEMTLQINPNAMATPNEPLLNSGVVTGRDSSGTEVLDTSDSGADAEEDNMEGGYSDPTGLILFDVNIAKTISNWTPNTNPWEPGHGEATFVMNVKNKGNTPVADVAVVDDIMAMYGPLFVGVVDPPVVTVIDNPGGFANPVVSAMGMTNPDYLSGPSQDTVWVADTIQANVTVSIEFTLELNPNAPGRPEPALNQASVAATDMSGNVLMDDSDSGTDPEGTNGGEVGDTGGEDDATVGLFPSINLAKTIDTVSIPGQFDPHGFPTTNPTTQVIVDHIHRIKNTSNVTLDSIRLSEPVGDPTWYGMYGAFVSIYGTPEILSAPATGMFAIDSSFDGLAQPEVLLPNPNMDGSDSLQVDEEIVIRIRVLIDVNFVPMDSILFNQSVTTGRGVFPGGNLGDVTDLSDSGTDAENENADDRLRNSLDLPNTGHDDPTPLPNCFDCSVNCVTALSASFDENCEFFVDNETIKTALPGLNPICVDLGFYDFKLENEQGGVAANPIRGERVKEQECRKFIPFNRLCPNVTCWTELCVNRIDLPIIRGTKYMVYCDDSLVSGPRPGEMPVAAISCEGEVVTEFIADWTEVRECVPGDDTIKIIYREYAATSRNGNRGMGFDTICVLRLPEITTANTYCTDRDTLYCGVGGPVGPYMIVTDLQPTDSELASMDACDTIFFVDKDAEGQYVAREMGAKCGILANVESHNFGDSLCEQIYKFTVEIKQTCFGAPAVACPVPTNPANTLESVGDNYWKCEFWLIDLDTLAPKIACKYDDYEDDNLLWPAESDAADPLSPNVHCYDTPTHPGSSIDAPVILAPTSSHDCAAQTYLPPVCVYEDWSGIKMVKATIDGIGSWVLEPGDSCVIEADGATGLCYQYHEPVHLPKTDYPYQIKYEAFDDCHNSETTYCYVLVKDRTKPVLVVDKGVTVSLSDKKVWVDAETFDEGSWDNCTDPMIYVRRADWYESCIDLCYNVKDGQCDLHAPEKEAAFKVCYIGEHHDTLWTTTLEDKKECDEVEAHYSKTLDWLLADGTPCGKLLYNAWQYDLMRYATSECRSHPYDLDAAELHKLIVEATLKTGFDSKFTCPERHNFCDPIATGQYTSDCDLDGDELDVEMVQYSQIGGGWSDAVAFDCEDACGMVTVEVLAIDYWCNWSKAWMDVWVEDKTPVDIVQDVVDGAISCKSYRSNDHSYPGEQHPVSIEYIVEQAKGGAASALGRLDDIFGGYDKAWRDDHGNYVDSSWTEINDDIRFSDSTCICETKVERVRKYDEHYGYIWKDSMYDVCRYDTLPVDFRQGIVVVNCAENVQCAQEVWCDIDHCGEGYLFRKFKIWQGCPAGSDAQSPHTVDTITRHQRISIGNSCDLNLAMFDLPEDVTVEACGVEFDPEGSGNVVGDAGPENTGMPVYTFDDDCRIVGIGREDKPFKILGGDEGCYKIIRTWYFADWCGGKPDNPYWYQNRDLVLDTFVQQILVIDTQPPVCEITTDMVAESGDGSAASPAVFAAQGGCLLNIETLVEVTDPCGLIDLYWELKDLPAGTVAASGSASLEGDTLERADISIADVGPGSYKLQARVLDQCQNESYCEYYLDVVSGKKPGPVCVTSLTAELQPWDTDQDGTVDTAATTIWATEFESSSSPPCGEDYEDLVFMIEWTDGASEVYDSNRVADTLAIGCDRVGTHSARMWVLSPSGTADYCDVVIIVQDNNSVCSDASSRAYVGGTTESHAEGQLLLGFELHQNRPNPFSGETAISFNLPATERATLTIYDATGRMLQKIERVFDKGYNSVEVKLNEFAAQGILFYQLDTREFTATRKMTMIN